MHPGATSCSPVSFVSANRFSALPVSDPVPVLNPPSIFIKPTQISAFMQSRSQNSVLLLIYHYFVTTLLTFYKILFSCSFPHAQISNIIHQLSNILLSGDLGAKPMLNFRVRINGNEGILMLDSGATSQFIDHNYAIQHNIPLRI